MEFEIVKKLLLESLEDIRRVHGADPHDARVSADGAGWLALQLLDFGRPDDWKKSKEREDCALQLFAIEREFVSRVEEANF